MAITTIRLDDKVKESGKERAKELNIRGGFSAYVELLIEADLNKKKPIYYVKKGESKRW